MTERVEGEVNLFALYQERGGDSMYGDFEDFLAELEESKKIEKTKPNHGAITNKTIAPEEN